MLDHLEKPFARCYWVRSKKLLAGSYPGSRDPREALEKLRGLLQCGVRRVVNLMEEDEKDHGGEDFVPYEMTLIGLARDGGVDLDCIRYPIRDGGVPSIEKMVAILDDIDHAIDHGKPVYVHCWGGVGRTGTVIGCYLARHGIAVGQACLELIQELRRNDPMAARISPETDEQRWMVGSWDAGA